MQGGRPSILVVYATRHGQSLRIASAISAGLTAGGAVASLADVRRHAVPDPGGFDAVVAVVPVHMGKHRREMVRWCRRNASALSARPGAVVSVSLSIAGADEDRARQANEEILDAFAAATGWAPDRRYAVAGRLAYTSYDPLTKRIMRRIAASEGRPHPDMSRDYELTDWDRVAGIAAEVARLASPQPHDTAVER